MYDFDSMFPGYTVSESGHVFRDGFQVHECKSNKYLQVYIYDCNHKGHVLGVHTVVAMKYLDYYTGCVVHHIDGDPHNNSINNLKILSNQEHARLHNKNNRVLANYVKKNGPVNKGKKMSDAFRQKCRESALKRRTNTRSST